MRDARPEDIEDGSPNGRQPGGTTYRFKRPIEPARGFRGGAFDGAGDQTAKALFMAAAAALERAPLVPLLLLLLLAAGAHAQLPNFRMALPPDVDPNNKLDVQPGYEL